MRMRGTLAWVRATSAVVVLVAGSVLVARPDLLALAVPLGIWVAWALVSRPSRVEVDVAGPRRVDEGAVLDLRTRVRADRPVTLTVVPWEDRLFDRAAPTVVRGRDAEVVDGVRTLSWGTATLEPTFVAVADDTGAWRAHARLGGGDVEVSPTTVSTAMLRAQAPQGVAGSHRARRRGEGTELFDVRPFAPGDRLRRINWRVSRRTGVLHANQTDPELDATVVVCVDSLQDTRGPDPDGPTTLDLTARAALAVAHQHLAAGDRVGLHDLGSRLSDVPAGTGAGRARIIAEVLTRTTRRRRNSAPSRRRLRVAPGTLVYVASPLLSDAVVDEVRRLHDAAATVVVVDTLPDALGPTALEHASAGQVAAEAWYLRWLERRAVVASLRDLGVPVVAWRGSAGLHALAAQVSRARSAPRLGRRR